MIYNDTLNDYGRVGNSCTIYIYIYIYISMVRRLDACC